MGWIALVAVLAGLAALPVLLERRRAPVTDAQRRTAPGGFADLSGGRTHYRWWGREDGPVMVLVHGLTGSSYVWEALLRELIANGARVLTYDLYGRGLSDRPGTAQTRSFFVRQLRELLQDQGVTGDISLVGYSMGGAIATVFAAEEPYRVDRLILIAPAGLTRTRGRAADLCRRLPLVGDWLMTVFGGLAMRRHIDPAAPSAVPDLAARQIAETRTNGYLRSLLSSDRHMLSERLEDEHRELQRMGVATLAVWGEDDATIPPRAMGELAQANRDARHAVIPGAGHGLVHTHPAEINRAVQEFLRETAM